MLKNRKENLNVSKKMLKVTQYSRIFSDIVQNGATGNTSLPSPKYFFNTRKFSFLYWDWTWLNPFTYKQSVKVYEIFSYSYKRVSPQLGVLKLLSSLSSHYHKIYICLPDESLLYLWSALFSCSHFSYYMICVEPYTPRSSVSWKSDTKNFLVVVHKVHL